MKFTYASLLFAIACASTEGPSVQVAFEATHDPDRPATFEGAESNEPEVTGADDFARVLLDVAHSSHDWSRPRPLELRFEWQSILTESGGATSVQEHKVWTDGVSPFKLPKITRYAPGPRADDIVSVLLIDYDRSQHDWNQEFAFLQCSPLANVVRGASFWGSMCDLRPVASAALVREYEAVDLYRLIPADPAAQFRIRRMHAIAAELARRGDEVASRQIRDSHLARDGSIPLLDVSGLEGVSTVEYGSCVRMELILPNGDDRVVCEAGGGSGEQIAKVYINNTGDYVMRMASPPLLANGALPSLALLVQPAGLEESSALAGAPWRLVPYVQDYRSGVDPWSPFHNAVLIPQRCSLGFCVDLRHYVDGLSAGSYVGKLVYADGVLWSHDDDWQRFRCIPSQQFRLEVR